MRGLADFVPGGFPLPWNYWNQVRDGMGDFVPGGFPVPQIPVGVHGGSLPRSPDMRIADIGGDGCGGLGNCGCAGCSGMGEFNMDTLKNLIPGSVIPGIPNTYLAAGVLVAFLVFSGARGRR